MPKVLMLSDITGLGPDYHVGDEAMAEVAIERLGKLVGKENLSLGCAAPEAVPETYGIRAFAFYHTPDDTFRKMRWSRPLSYLKAWFTNIREVMACDKVLVCGGGNMTSVWPGVLEARMRLLRLAVLFRKDIYLVSQTIGPYEPHHRARIDRILRHAKWVGVRDINFSHTQTDAPVHFALDDACFLSSRHSDRTRELATRHQPYCCVSMRKFGKMDQQAVQNVAASIQCAVHQQDVSTIFIPHHAPQGTEGDVKLANSIEHLWPEGRFESITPIPLASSLKALTSDSQFVITMRYHQLIFALSTGVPAVGICADHYTEAKLRGAFEAFGLKPLVTSVENAERELDTLLSEALTNRSAFESAAKQVMGEPRNTNERPYLLIADVKSRATEQPHTVANKEAKL